MLATSSRTTFIGLGAVAYALAASFTPSPATAQQPTTFGSASGVSCPGGNVLCNGSINFMTTELFFEPETPAQSLKKGNVTWNELEQLLDNPYNLTTGAACNDANGPIPPTFTGYPTYCTDSSFIRRPSFGGVTLPPVLVSGLNYNPTTGGEMRLLNPNYGGGSFDHTNVCYRIGPDGAPCTPPPSIINVTSGASRGLAPDDHEIAYNTAIGRKAPFCQGNPEPVPLGGVDVFTGLPFGGPFATSFDAQDLTTCGSDPGEPGAAQLTSLATDPLTLSLCGVNELGGFPASYLCEDNVGLPFRGQPGRNNWYSAPAVPAPNAATAALMQIPNGTITGVTTGTTIPVTSFTGNYLHDGSGTPIRPRNIASGQFGLNKPSLRVFEAGGNGDNPNYLINVCSAGSSSSTCDSNKTVLSNENDYIGLFGSGTIVERKQKARLEAMVLGKALFWEQQIGSDGVQACGSCHAHAGADNRTKNQINPVGQDGISGAPTFFNTNPGSLAAFTFPPNYDLQQSDFPFLKLTNPEVAGDYLCNPPIVANVTGFTFPDDDPPDHPKVPPVFTVCDAANRIRDTDDVASSMGVHFGLFYDIPPIGTGPGQSFGPPSHGVRALVRDLRSPIAVDNVDPIAGFQGASPLGTMAQFRRVEPRNTPTVFLAGMNFDNFWDGRAKHDDNGGSVFGDTDPQAHVWVDQGTGLVCGSTTLCATRQRIRFSSVASLAKGPALSKFEMSFVGRNWAKHGKKMLQRGVTPLANQLVDPTDSILGRYSNQGGSECASLPAGERSPQGEPPTALGPGVPGLCINYRSLIRHAFYRALRNNSFPDDGEVVPYHLNGCYTDGRADIHPNQCGTGIYPAASISVLDSPGVIAAHNKDPFDDFVLYAAPGPAVVTDTNQFNHMEANMSLFFGQSINAWFSILVPDDTPDDKFLDANPDIGMTTGETGEPLLVLDAPSCNNVPAGYVRDSIHPNCFTEVGDFKRDDDLTDTTLAGPLPAFTTDATGNRNYIGGACLNEVTIAGIRNCTQRVAAPGTRHHGSNEPNPLLGFDLFFGSNASLKNPEFRSARCGACHNAPNLTDNTFPFTLKAQLVDAQPEFEKSMPRIEPLEEPLTRPRIISGFLLESEVADNGGDAIEGNVINLSIVPAPVVNNNGNCTTASCSGYSFPDAITNNAYDPFPPSGQPVYGNGLGYRIHTDLGTGPVAGGVGAVPVPFTGFGHSFFDNGVYNIGVRPCVADQKNIIGACEDGGRGDTDPFGWPMSLAAIMLKDLGGPAQQAGVPIAQFNPSNANAGGRVDAPPCAPYCASGGLYALTKQDQQINPGYDTVVANHQIPEYVGPFSIPATHGDGHPQQDEVCGAPGVCINTLTDSANNEGFGEFPFDPRPGLSEVVNSAVATGNSTIGGPGYIEQGTWPLVNRVTRFGSIKAPQLREVELTGPYFHNGGKLTLRQVVDFYVRGGDFPVTNSHHRDFNILNLNAETQSDLSEEEKVALVDYMLTFTDDRVAREAAPFDHPQMILPLDGTAPESDGTVNRDVMLGGTCTPSPLGPGQRACTSSVAVQPVGATGPLFLDVPATGAAGNLNGPGGTPARVPNFLGISSGPRLVGDAANCLVPNNHYCH